MEIIYHTPDGIPYTLNENGEKQIPLRATDTKVENNFTTYVSNAGHCQLCGNLLCRGSCFK